MFLEEIFEKVDFEKFSRRSKKKHAFYHVGKELLGLFYVIDFGFPRKSTIVFKFFKQIYYYNGIF